MSRLFSFFVKVLCLRKTRMNENSILWFSAQFVTFQNFLPIFQKYLYLLGTCCLGVDFSFWIGVLKYFEFVMWCIHWFTILMLTNLEFFDMKIYLLTKKVYRKYCIVLYSTIWKLQTFALKWPSFCVIYIMHPSLHNSTLFEPIISLNRIE